MAGPLEAGSRTRIIGTGFKPLNSSVNLKWGILESDIITKSIVEDYIYTQLGFENIIDGSEELKAYVYEASQFPRVDTALYENQAYHSY